MIISNIDIIYINYLSQHLAGGFIKSDSECLCRHNKQSILVLVHIKEIKMRQPVVTLSNYLNIVLLYYLIFFLSPQNLTHYQQMAIKDGFLTCAPWW